MLQTKTSAAAPNSNILSRFPYLTSRRHLHIYHPGVFPLFSSSIPENTGHRLKAGLMLDHRLRRWPNIDPALGGRHVFAVIHLLRYTIWLGAIYLSINTSVTVWTHGPNLASLQIEELVSLPQLNTRRRPSSDAFLFKICNLVHKHTIYRNLCENTGPV